MKAPSFDFGPSLVMKWDLDTFAKHKWFARRDARVLKGETMPKPHDDEVVVFHEFFLAGLRFSVILFVVEVPKRFRDQI